MKYVLMFTGRAELDDAVDPALTEKVYQEVFAWFDEHGKAGRIANGGAELQPVSTATTVRGTGDRAAVVDGPFIEAKEVIGGFTVVDVPDLDAAIAMARTWPPLVYDGSAVEIRPIIDHEM